MPKQIEVMTEYNLDELKQVKVELEMNDVNEDMKHNCKKAIARDIESPTDLSVIVALHGGSLTGLLLKNDGVVANSKIVDIEEIHLVQREVKIINRSDELRSVEAQIYSPGSCQNAPEDAVWSPESKEIFHDTEQTQINFEDVTYIEIRSQDSEKNIFKNN